MAKVTFLFDIIVTRLELIQPEIQKPEKLLVKVKFEYETIDITACRINASEFQVERQTEYTATHEDLRKNLDKNGLPMTLFYGGINIGESKITFLRSFIDRIDSGMNEVIHAEACPITRQNEEIGFLDVLCHLTVKGNVDELVLEKEQELEMKKCNKICVDLGKDINHAEMMFLVGAPEPCAISCPLPLEELKPNADDMRLKLDLERYHSMNQRAFEPNEMMSGGKAYFPLKVLPKQYDDFIDAVNDGANDLPSPIIISDNLFMQNQQKPYNQHGFDRTIPISVADMQVMGVKPISFCPYCLISLSSMPNYAYCPRCCTKTMPPFDDRSDNMLTSDQTIQQFINVNPYNEKESLNYGNSKTSKKFGSCTLDSMCAHCQVLNACVDNFKCELNVRAAKSKDKKDRRV